MICEKCNENPAVIEYRYQINDQKNQLYVCKSCHKQIKTEPFDAFSMFDDMFSNSFFDSSREKQKSPQTRVKEKEKTYAPTILDKFGKNLNKLASEGKIDHVIGRKQEIEQVIEILNRRTKNNPVLIGEPGVGKTAIAEGLALKIVENDVPSKLADKCIYSLDVASLVSDTGIRGQFEQRMQSIIAELEKRTDIIVFIDELHLLVGAGKAEGSMDASNILKPALARGDMQVIGATTLKEYRQIEKDSALERRFQPVLVQEPTEQDTIAILKGLRPKYEEFHNVSYSDEVLEASVQLSTRYIQDRYLPDKAIDLLDTLGSRLNLQQAEKSVQLNDLQRQADMIKRQKEQATLEEKYEDAARYRKHEVQALEDLKNFKQEKMVATVEELQLIIEKKTGIPVQKLQKAEQAKTLKLHETLLEKVIGQKTAVEKVAKAIKRSRAGLKPKNRPIASFLFVGPTGVGKTELTKVLAEELFGSKDHLIRLDMSEYMEKHSVSKLIGSPPGYIGHEEAGQLTERVRRNPYSILLLDELEKAHNDIQHIFLQILEDGHLTDSQGRKVDFKNTIIIATSNAGVSEKKKSVGFTHVTQEEVSAMNGLKRFFKPEFLNRFDNIITFNHLEKDELIQIVDLLLVDLNTTLSEQGIMLSVTQEVKNHIAEIGYDPSFGARPLRRAIQEKIEDEISDFILENQDIKTLHIDYKEGKILLTT